ATPEALAEQSDDLLSDLFDQSMARQDVEPVRDGARAEASVPDVDALLRLLWSQKLRSIDRVPGTLGDTYALACKLEVGEAAPRIIEAGHEAGPLAVEATGAALAVDGMLAHLSIGGAPPRATTRAKGAQAGAGPGSAPAFANLPTNAV